MNLSPGARVRTSATLRGGHCRLPAYARAHTGEVVAMRGRFPLADDLAAGRKPPSQALVTVRFLARQLWNDAEPQTAVYADLFEDYLEPADPGDRQ